MFEFFALITNKRYWYFHSFIIKIILKMYGIKIGKNFYCEGVPKLKIKGKAKNITIGDDVCFLGNIDLRNRENGKIIIGNQVALEDNVRLVSANDSILKIGNNTGIGSFTIINSGVDIIIGEHCLISGMCYIQSSDHGIQKDKLIVEQNHTYGKIAIGDDVWIGSNATITKGAILKDGCVVGAKSLVKAGEYEENSILVGVPAKRAKYRK